MAASGLTPYEILGLEETANELEVRTAYRNHILALKKDRLKSSRARTITAEKFRQICRAYEALSDRDKKRQYDTTFEWTSHVLLDEYSLQQLAAEPDLALELKNRLRSATMAEINDQEGNTKLTALHCAARACNAEAVRYLTEQDANPDVTQRTGSTALHAGAFYGHAEVVQCLLESGANYNLKNDFDNLAEEELSDESLRPIFARLKENPYVQAAANQLKWFETNSGQISEHIDHQYFFLRQTLLHCASKKGHVDLVRWLVERRGANLDIIDGNSNSPLHLAASKGYVPIVEYLLDQGANSLLLNKWGMTAEEEGLRHRGKVSCIFEAMRARNMFQMAADGADWWFRYHFGTNSVDATNSDGASLLYIAARCGKPIVVAWLLENGANVNIQLTQASKSTALHAAVFYGHQSIAEILLSYGADVNIRNGFNSTVFDDAQSNEMRKLLQQHRQNLQGEKLLSVHLFSDGGKAGNEALAKLFLCCDATIDQLLEAMSDDLRKKFDSFSIARRPLAADADETKLVSIVARARHGKTQLIELPLCLTAHERVRYGKSGHVLSPELPFPHLRDFHKTFVPEGQSSSLTVKAKIAEVQRFTSGDLILTFPSECTEKKVSLALNYVSSPSSHVFQPPGCICLFELRSNESNSELNEMPTALLKNAPDARLYCWTQSSAYWLAANTKQTRLFSVNRVHAFVRHVDVIPSLLSLPADMFVQAAAGQSLFTRSSPVSCKCLKIRDQNKKLFPDIAYHGTNIDVVCSILLDGLVMPNTVVSSGIRVCPPNNHIARGKEAFGIADFANGIFVTPSIHYCSDPAYAVTFSDGDQLLFPVLEYSVKRDGYKAYGSTVSGYTAHSSDNLDAIEWRLTNPADIEILSVLFIPLLKSRIAIAQSRAKMIGVNPHNIT